MPERFDGVSRVTQTWIAGRCSDCTWNHRVVNALRSYGMTDELYRCPNYSVQPPVVATEPRIDYVSRYAIMGVRTDGVQVTWRVVPPDGFVLAYCPYHRSDPGSTAGPGQPRGFFLGLRMTGGVQRIPASQVIAHTEDWGGFGPDIDPNTYEWLQFPGESFPPTVIKND